MFFMSHRTFVDRVYQFVIAKDAELAAERAARAFAMQRLSEVKLEHVRELEEMRRRLSISQANFEWLSISHNHLTEQNSQLMLKRGVVQSPMLIDTGGGSQPPREREDRPAAPDIASAVADGTLFEDVGNARASRENLERGEVYDTNSTVLRD